MKPYFQTKQKEEALIYVYAKLYTFIHNPFNYSGYVKQDQFIITYTMTFFMY